MSRSYILYFEWKNISEDKMWLLLCKWCTHSQIFRVRMLEFDEGYAYVEMGCSSGVAPEDTMYCFKEDLEKNGAKEVDLKAWSLHPDKAINIDEE